MSAWLQTEANKARKQKRTVMQLHSELKSLGYDGSYNHVAAFPGSGQPTAVEGLHNIAPSAMATSNILLRIDRLAALQHVDEIGDLLLTPGFGLHVVQPECERVAVLRAESCQHLLSPRFNLDCRQ